MKLRFNEASHSYWLDGKRCKSVTAVAKIPDDLYRLQQWEKRQVAIGLASSPDLVEAVAAHVEDDDLLNQLCDQAKETAGANRGARRGTAAHRVTERHDEGKEIIPTSLSTSILASWTEILDRVGLEVIPELMERVVVYPQHLLCGKFDRIMRTRDGRLVIVDLKSGARAIRYPHSAAVQLALYGHAPLMAGPLDGRGETTVFEPLPEGLDLERGIIIHLPEDGPAQAVELDIATGWKVGAAAARACLRWRQHSAATLIRTLATVEPPPEWDPDEGPDVTTQELQDLRDAFKTCPGKTQVDAWLKQSIDAGRSFHPTPPHGKPSLRRTAIIAAAIAWAEHEEDVVRAGLGFVTGSEPQMSVPTGAVFGSLTIEEARRLAAIAGTFELRFSDDGKPFVGAA